MPVLRAITSRGAEWDDPSEDLLFELLRDIEQGVEEFVIVERTEDPSGQTFAQAIREPDGGWTLERHEGSADRHVVATFDDLRSAHEVLTTWAFDLAGWETMADWAPIELP